MGIAGMVIWALTVGIGIYLLAVGISAQRAAGLVRARAAAAAAATAQADSAGAVAVAATQADSAGVEAAGRTGATAADGTDGPAPAGTDSAGTDSTAVGTQALAVVLSGGPAPAAPPEGSPLLEFTHPALALLGLTFWIFFVMTGDRLFAWIAFGVLVATVTAGLSWELSRRRTARQRAARRVTAGPGGDQGSGGQGSAADGPGFPPHLVLAHGAAAACTFALVVIAAVAAGHG